MNVSINRDGEFLTAATVNTIHDIPGLTFAASQHYGSGEYVVVESAASTGERAEPLFRLTTEWLEGEA